MLNVLERIEYFANKSPDRLVFKSSYGEITYGELWEESEKIAEKLLTLEQEGKLVENEPIGVYGHKEPAMVIAFIGCARANHPYCPMDKSMPESRIKDIFSTIGSDVGIVAEDKVINFIPIDISMDALPLDLVESSDRIQDNVDDEVMYIIFTSGSTGMPKGVEVTRDNLSNFLEWMTEIGTSRIAKEGKIFLNQAPYSFDLSVMDTYTALVSGGTIVSLDKNTLADAKSMMNFIREEKPEYWTSTPSFVDMALAEKEFNQENFPHIKIFFFCGERLTKRTAQRLITAFPDSKIFNTYGPTESTVAVTKVQITKELIEEDGELPVGEPKPGTEILIQKEDGSFAENGEEGEIIIKGNTLAKGYYKSPDKTSAAFEETSSGRQYHTGDKGFIRNGQLFCSGRMDLQVKVHGYRMELGDIEANILLQEDVESVCVVPKYQDGKIRSLVGFVVAPNLEGSFTDSRAIKAKLGERLPDYMIPKKIKFIDCMPVTSNGKINRKKLEEMA
ncbi:D-alanine--poly(phosphoribitol) ligase subunit DltA [Eubacteriales bacterium KG127]